MGNDIPMAGVSEQVGTARFGNNSSTSVLDAGCMAHDHLDDVYGVDAGVFPSICALSPAWTVTANALRVGDDLLERLHS